MLGLHQPASLCRQCVHPAARRGVYLRLPSLTNAVSLTCTQLHVAKHLHHNEALHAATIHGQDAQATSLDGCRAHSLGNMVVFACRVA